MTALHVRDVPEPVVAALRERAARRGHSMQQELRQILAEAAAAAAPAEATQPIGLHRVTTTNTSTWSRDEIYGDTGR